MISIYKPGRDDLWFREKMLSDRETMSYNHSWGGAIPFPKEDWDAWYDCWIADHKNKRYYRYLRDGDEFVGEIAYHFDEDGRCLANVIIFAPYRGKGYGGAALDMLCEAAKENGAAEIYDDIAADNPAISMFLKHGFAEEYRTDEIIMLKKVL